MGKNSRKYDFRCRIEFRRKAEGVQSDIKTRLQINNGGFMDDTDDILKDFIAYFQNQDWQTQDEILYQLFKVSVNWQCYAEEQKATEAEEALKGKEPNKY